MRRLFLKNLGFGLVLLSQNVFAGFVDRLAVGVEHSAFVGGTGLNNIHAQYSLAPEAFVGVSLGFGADFDQLNISGDFRYDLHRAQAVNLYTRATVGFAKGVFGGAGRGEDGDDSGLTSALLLGFEYALTAQLKLFMAYGIHLAVGAGESNLSFTQNGALGNFGVRWYF